MSDHGPVVRYQDVPRTIINESKRWGQWAYDLVGPPRRLYADGIYTPPLLEQYVDTLRVDAVPSPAELVGALPSGDSWLALSARSLARLHALFLIAEDPQERLAGRSAATLAHQVSLVHYLLTSSDLRRVLIADEVGLGKTIEAGLLIKALLDQQQGLRVLYLAPARLVTNVYREFREKLELPFRMFAADDRAQADIRSDSLVIASIHRAVHPANRETVVGTSPWDVIVVDECHHLSARGPNGQDANEHYDLVRALVERQAPEARVLLMSGTPHQGNRLRFDNLLAFLRAAGETRDAVRGRVIFRTKEDVRDWDGRPLFPRRNVRQPTLVELGEAYRSWYEAVGALYDDVQGSDARRRAGGWAKGQALQWVASSVQAGMGFLVRLGMRRLNWDLRTPGFSDAVAALRPYKNGAADEPVEQLYGRLVREIARQRAERDVADMEETEEESWRPDATALRSLLRDGLALLRSPAAVAKWQAIIELLAETPHEKVVLFAQPVETVTSLVAFLREHGEQPAVIIGGQSDADRDAQIMAFRRPDGPRLLVSSRAGGEGLNLQVSRRLVHIDVPWNPMELEQRVGRVHRFGSQRTILVDTLLVRGTREVDAYRVAREKLAVAFGDLASDPEKFETLFARVMSLVPPQELEDVISRPMVADTEERLGDLVADGLRRWREFHETYETQRRALYELDPGAATWDDLARFLVERERAELVSGVTIPDFQEMGEEVVTVAKPVPAVRLDGRVFACGDTRGVPVTDAAGQSVPIIGLNSPEVATRLREAAFPPLPVGAAWLRLTDDAGSRLDQLLPSGTGRPFGVVAVLRQTIRAALGNVTEQGVRLRLAIVSANGEMLEVSEQNGPALVRALLASTRQREPDAGQAAVWRDRLVEAERALLPRLGEESEEERREQIRHALWPVFAAVVA